MRCKAWVVVKQARKKGSGEPKEKVTAVADAYDRPGYDPPQPNPAGTSFKTYAPLLDAWVKVRRRVRQIYFPTPPKKHPDAVRCGGEIVASVRVYDEPYMGGTSATLEVAFTCKRCGHTYHGVDVDALRDADEIAKLLTKYIARLPDMVYNPDYGDDKLCKCGHPYYRHFDSYEDMEPVGCKYCDCGYFEQATEVEVEEIRKAEAAREPSCKACFHEAHLHPRNSDGSRGPCVRRMCGCPGYDPSY